MQRRCRAIADEGGRRHPKHWRSRVNTASALRMSPRQGRTAKLTRGSACLIDCTINLDSCQSDLCNLRHPFTPGCILLDAVSQWIDQSTPMRSLRRSFSRRISTSARPGRGTSMTIQTSAIRAEGSLLVSACLKMHQQRCHYQRIS